MVLILIDYNNLDTYKYIKKQYKMKIIVDNSISVKQQINIRKKYFSLFLTLFLCAFFIPLLHPLGQISIRMLVNVFSLCI